MKRPSFQFYPGDWLNDAALRSCSVGARGLWIEMICLMHQGSTYGYLKVNGKVILPPNLARMVGATLPEVKGWLSELVDAGVYSIDDNGAIFSRRMIRDEEIRQARAAGGFKGGNPALKGANGGSDKVGDKVNLPPNLRPTPSSSSSSSEINTPPNPPSEVKPKKPPKEIRAVALPPGFEITPEMRAWAAERRLSVDIDYATERWKNSMAATGKKYSDWTRAWNNGMLKADEWAREKNPNNVTPLPSLRPRKEMPLP